MQRRRISKEAAEGVLGLQQLDAQAARDAAEDSGAAKKSGKAKRAAQAQQSAELASFLMPGVSVPASSLGHRVVQLSQGESSTKGWLHQTSAEEQASVSEHIDQAGAFAKLAARLTQTDRPVTLSFARAVQGEAPARLFVGYLQDPGQAPAETVQACRVVSRRETASLIRQHMPRQPNNQALAEAWRNIFGTHPGLLVTAGTEDRDGKKASVLIMRPPQTD